MRISSKISICIAAVLLCLGAASCKKDTTIQYNNMTMGNIVNGTFVSDQGNIFNIVEQDKSCNGDLMTLERAYILCDVLNKTVGGLDNEYDVRLNAMAQVTTKDILPFDSEIEEDKLKEDPISIEYIWFSGGYINFYVMFPVKVVSETAHMVNLVQQESSEGYVFRFTHNAFGETLENGDSSEYAMAGGYISFPISTFIHEDEANVKVEWTWYKTIGMGLTQDTEVISATVIYKKDGFEHMPKALKEKAKTIVR